MTKALIVYGTRYGAAASTSEEIAKILRQEGVEVRVVNAKEETKSLDEKAAQYHLQPAALGFFGGVYNYNKVPWWGKKAMEMDRPRVEAAYKQTEPGIYDTRDWNAIRSWAKELAQRFHS